MSNPQAEIITESDVTIGGIPVRDPFRWLEQDSDPAVIAWQKEADDRTVAELADSRHAPAVTAAVHASFEDLYSATAPERFGDNWFRKVVADDGSRLLLMVSDSPATSGRLLVDPAEHGPSASIGICHPSPDGTLLLIGITTGGLCRYRILTVADGSVAHEISAVTMQCLWAWAHDNSGLYHSSLTMKPGPDGQPAPQYEILWRPLTGEPELQPTELDHPMGWPVVSADGRWVAVMADQTSPRPRWIKRIDGGAWTRVLADATAMYKGCFVGDEYWAITDDLSGWGRLVAIPLDSVDDRSTWRELLPAREEVKLASITRCGDFAALSTIEGGVMRMTSLDARGVRLGDVPLPGDGAFGLFGFGHIAAIMGDIVGPDGDGCVFVHSSLDRGCGVYRADLARLTVEEIEAPAHRLTEHEVQRFTADGPHGLVAYWILRRRSTPLDGSAPLIVTGYGGFNVPTIPNYSAMGAAWSELGGVWVHSQLRGGGERDTEFWHAGRMHRKQGTFDDLFAVIEDLQARGFATPARTGVFGTSNGGLLVCATVTQRPELIGAAVAQVPVCDLVRLAKDPVTGNIVKADYGDPAKPDDAAAMFAYSPYHRVREGTAYPALLCDSGADDVTCPPWHSRKMVAAVEAASSAGQRTRLRVRKGSGHNQMTPKLFIERDIEELTFFRDELA